MYSILVSSSHLAKHFTDECVKICSVALKCLGDLIENLKPGKIKIWELRILTSNSSQARNLFSTEITKVITDDPTYNIVDVIAERNSEVQKFESYCSTVRTLLEHCESISNGMYTFQVDM